MIKEVQPRTGGYVLVSVLALGVLLILMVSISSNIAVSTARATTTEARKTQAFYAAQSGVERAVARLKALEGVAPVPAVYSNTQYAQWLAGQLNNIQATHSSAGRFLITASATAGASSTDPARLTIFSQGFSVNDSSRRRISMTMPITMQAGMTTLFGAATAALTITGNSSVNGSAPIAGELPSTGDIHIFNCPAVFQLQSSCSKSSAGLEKYTLHYQGSIPDNFSIGKVLRPTSEMMATGQTSEERYIVTKVDPSTGMVDLAVYSDYIKVANSYVRRTFSASQDIKMQELNGIPALMLPPEANFSNISNNVKDVCNLYTCEHYTLSPDAMFQLIMGGTKEQVEQRFIELNKTTPGSYNTSNAATCNPNAQWMNLSQNKSSINSCGPDSAQLLIVDARGQTKADIDLPTQGAFRGLLYVLADPGVQVKFASNMGFVGAMVIDNGNGGVDMMGTAQFNDDCKDEVAEGLPKVPKLCYDASVLAQLNSQVAPIVNQSEVYKIDYVSGTWAEVGQ